MLQMPLGILRGATDIVDLRSSEDGVVVLSLPSS